MKEGPRANCPSQLGMIFTIKKKTKNYTFSQGNMFKIKMYLYFINPEFVLTSLIYNSR